MKIRWSKPFEKKFYQNENSLVDENSNHNYINKEKNFIRYESKNILTIMGSINNNYSRKNLLNDREIDNNKKYQHFVHIDKYIFLFNNPEVLIFKFIDSSTKQYYNETEQNYYKYFSDYNSTNLNKKEESDFILLDIKKISFLSYDENINFCLLNKINNNIILSTDAGIIYIININLIDLFIDLDFSFNIKQNYLYNYQIHYFCENNKILLTLDNNLYICEIYKKKKNQPTQVFKNCLFKCVYMDEKILHAEKLDSLVSIFTNKAIYIVDFYDMSSSILYKKEKLNNYSGKMFNDNIYFIKDENTYAVYSIKDIDKKLSFKLSSKNQLNVLNFNTILYVDEDILLLVNDKNTEIYTISLVTYKVLNRESILFDNPKFLVFSINDNKSSNLLGENQKLIIPFSFNEISFEIRYKLGYIKTNILESVKDEKIESENIGLIKESLETNDNFQKRFVGNNRRELDKNDIINKGDLETLSGVAKIQNLFKNKNDKKREKNKEIYELKEFEKDYIEESNVQDCINYQLRNLRSYISYLLRISRYDEYLKIFKLELSHNKFQEIILQLRKFINVYSYVSSLSNIYKKSLCNNYFSAIDNRIKLNGIYNFGSYNLKINTRLFIEFYQIIVINKLDIILEHCKLINDITTGKQILKKFCKFINLLQKNNFLGFYNL